MKNKILLILGADKLGGRAYNCLNNHKNIDIVIDRSLNFKKIFKLIIKKKVTLVSFLKIIHAEFKRNGKKPPSAINSIKDNVDLIRIIKEGNYTKVILFRAGLIINKNLLNKKIPFFNLHAAKIPEYGGLCSIEKAIKNGDYNQFASFHEVTTSIDKGILIDSQDFILRKENNYAANEEIAYSAALKLLYRNILSE